MPQEQIPEETARAHLIAAAEAARDWARARRAVWTDVPLPPPPRPLPRPAQPPPVAPEPVVASIEPSPQVSPAPDIFQEPTIGWPRRLALAVTVVAIVGAAGWMVRSQWPRSAAPDKDAAPVNAPLTPAPTPAAPASPKPAPVAIPSGRLEVQSNPDGATVVVDGQERGVAPLTLTDLPAGPHTVLLQSDKGSVERRVQVEADSTTRVDEGIFPGWLHVTSTIDLAISDGSQGLRLNDESAVLLPPGPHTLRFENTQLGYSVTREVVIKPGETMAISIVPGESVRVGTARQH